MNIQYQYSTCLMFIKIIFIDCAPKLKILFLDPLLLEPISNTDEIETKNKILRNSNNHSNNPDPIITTENIRIDIRKYKEIDSTYNQLPSSGYDYDSKLCKNVKDKILCGYNKNKGSFSDENIIKLSNGCRIRGERIECGYDSKPLITSKTPRTQFLREGNLISERVLENVTKIPLRTITKLKLNVTETFNTTKNLMDEVVNETEIYTEKSLKNHEITKTHNEMHIDVTKTNIFSEKSLKDCETRKTNNELLKDVTQTEIFSDTSLKDRETSKTNNENILRDVTQTEIFSDTSLKDRETSNTNNENILRDVTETEIFSDKSLKDYETRKTNNENILKYVTETEIFSDKSLKDYETRKTNNKILRDVIETEVFSDKSSKGRETKKDNSEMLEHIIETEIFSEKSVKDRETRKNNKETFNDVTEASETKYSDTSIYTENYGATGSTLSTTTSTIAVLLKSTLTKVASEPYHVYCVENDDRIVCYKIKL